MNFKKIDKLNDFSFIVLVSVIPFLIWYLLLGYKIINQPYIWDDLHLIRSFSWAEIINSWKGNWDSDGVETPSYRPIAILFYNFIGSIFEENYVFLRVFTFLLMIGLIIETNLILYKLGFGKKQILIFSLLIIFTKIYTTLLSWLTLSALIFCYVLVLLSIIFFIDWLEKKNNKYLLLSIFFGFLCVFTRETMYVLPGIIYLILIYRQKKIFFNIKKNLIIVFPFLLIVLVHLFLRKLFIAEASNFDFNFGNIKFGGEKISLGNFIKTFKASWLPMGLWTMKKFYILQSISFFSWVLSIMVATFLCLKYINLTKITTVNFIVFFLILIFLNLPSIVIARPFGIMLPSLVVFIFIAFLINNLINIKNFYSHNKTLKLICNTTIFLIVLSNICGGYFRSNEHIKAMNVYSTRIIYFDAMSIYDQSFKHIKIEKIEYDKKIKHLKNLNINNWNDVENLDKNTNSKIYIANFSPLEF